MYEDFFGLSQRPFSAAPNSEEFVSSTTCQEALEALLHCLTGRRGIALVCSAPGLGKTWLCHRLAHLLDDGFLVVTLSAAGFPTRRALLQAILYELGIAYIGLSEQEARLQLVERAKRSRQDGRPLLLIVDEAHLLNARLFEELRVLADLTAEGAPLVHLVLSGQFELEEKLADPALSAFNQRVGVQVCLDPWSWEDSARLILERLRACGCSDAENLFTPAALELLCQASDGNPRCLAQIADHCLLLAYAEESRQVSEKTVREALRDLRELPLRWTESPEVDDNVIPTKESEMVEVWDDERHFDELQTTPYIDAANRDTDEYIVPESLRENYQAMQPQVLPLTALESHANSTEIEAPFAVVETNESGVAFLRFPQPEQSAPAPSVPSETPQFEPLMTPPMTAVPEWLAPPRLLERRDCAMQESVVVDRCALLDRWWELPENRRFELEFASEETLATADVDDFQESAPSHSSAAAEFELLETIQQIRHEIIDAIEFSQLSTRQLGSIARPQPASGFDVVHPEQTAPSTAAGESTRAATPDAAVEDRAAEEPQRGRYAQLFSRLSRRRREAAGE